MLGTQETLIIAGALIVIFFGPSLLPRIGRGIGESIKEMRKVKAELNEPIEVDKKS